MAVAAWFRERFELARGGGDHNLRPMEGLRGAAVFLVFLVHYASLIAPWMDKASATWGVAEVLRDIGHSGVDLFFVLSGYLIYGSLILKPRPILPYLGRRIQRIYPAFLVVLAMYVLLSYMFPFENKISKDPAVAIPYILANVLLLPGIFPIEPIITVAWSLSYEVFYYIAIPIVIIVLRSRPSAIRVILFVLAAMGMALFAEYLGQRVRLIMFLAGMVLWEHREVGGLRVPPNWVGIGALAGGFVAMAVPMPLGVRYGVLAVLFHLFTLTSLAPGRHGLLQASLCWTPLRWLGNMSYSYYLLHGLALKGTFLVLGKVLPPAEALSGAFFWGAMAPLFALTLIPTAILFLAVERPFSLGKPKKSVGSVGSD